MRSRVGIELTPVVCRSVEVADFGRTWRAQGGDSLVRSFGVWPASDADAVGAALASHRGKAASVIVWGTASEHCQVEVRLGSYEAMRAEALRTLRDTGVPTRNAWADIAPAGPADGVRRRVAVAVAAAPSMAAAVQPLIDAGIRVRTVMTPAAALAAIARSRRAHSAPDAIEAYVALEEAATCVALLRSGSLMAARDLPWGFLDGYDDEPRRREDIAFRLGDDLADFFAAYEDEGRVSQVCLCGGLPELRSTTLPLMERFDVEVEILDSLSGIDARYLPEPADEFRDRASELRLAWVAAADWTTINLLRAGHRQTSHAMLSRAAVVAGVAAGLGGGWSIAGSDAWRTPEPSVATHAAVNVAPALPPPLRGEPPAVRQPPPRVAEVPPRVAEVPPPVAQEPPVVAHEPPPMRQEPASIAEVPSRAAAAPPPVIRSEPAMDQLPPVVRRVTRAAPPRIARPGVGDALPFEAALSGILFSPDRQLAIIDGRVVGRGDAVRGATVVEISAGAVLLRDSQGRLRRLSPGEGGR